MEEKEYILESYEASNKEKPGLNFGEIVLNFKDLDEKDFIVSDKVTTDYRDSQYLFIKQVEKDKLTVILFSDNPNEWLNLKDLQEGTKYYKL